VRTTQEFEFGLLLQLNQLSQNMLHPILTTISSNLNRLLKFVHCRKVLNLQQHRITLPTVGLLKMCYWTTSKN